MADAPEFDPSKPFDAVGAPAFDPDKPFEVVGGGGSSRLGRIVENAALPITSLPETYRKTVHESLGQMGQGVEQIKSGQPWEVAKGLGNVALGGMGYVGAPISAPIHTIVGKPVEEVTGIPSEYTDFATSLALPVPKAVPRVSALKAELPPPVRMMDVTLSEGQATRDLPAIQREQAALRGASGPPAQKVAQAFTDQQQAELAAARDKITRSLDPFEQRIVETPQEAGELAQRGMQSTAAARKAGVDTAYRVARGLPGEIHAGVFEGMGQKIKGDLTLGESPVVIDNTTPFAGKMIRDIEDFSNLHIQNRADPFGDPNPERIVGVNLKGVDQMRKRLSAFRRDAFASGNGADGRAARAVLDAFDDQIDKAVNSGLFRGDPRAVAAWNDARAAHADYKRAFSAGKNDPVGRVVERILGKGNNPAAIPNDVADFMYSSAGVNPSSLNVGVATRVKSILGDRSPEWSAVKQGLFSRLTETGEGVKDFGAGTVAQRINRFLNADGREMADVLFSKPERDLMQQYANLMRHIEVPQAGANWSNTATFAGEAYKPSLANRGLQAVGSNVGMVISGLLGHFVVPGLPYGAAEMGSAAAAKIAGMSAQAREARLIARQMPLMQSRARSFRDAANVYETSPTARNAARMAVASQELSTSLKDVGINMSPDQIMRSGAAPQIPAPDQRASLEESPQRASGGRVDKKKLPHSAVGYVNKSNLKGKHCSVCSMFVADGPACTLVKSPINPAGWCRRFDPKPKT
jgi:hypothetical protein